MLSKSDLQSLLQCKRRLWLEHHRPDLIPRDDPVLYRRAVDGQIVGKKAREQLGPDFIWPPAHDDKAAAAERAKAMLAASAGKPAAEFPMTHGGLYARADALLPEDRRYILRETKASTFPLKKDRVTPADPEDHHLNDVAIQTWVMEGCGLPLGRIELNLLNNQWRYPGGGDYGGLFRQLDVTGESHARKANVPGWIADARAVLAGGMPDTQTGRHCREPYSCPFRPYCETLDPPGPEHPIELLPDLAGKGLAKKLRETKGYTSILEPHPNELTGAQAALYRRIHAAHRTGEPVFEPGSDERLKALPYPRYFFDFEGIDFPVPRWAGVRPYEHVPFQWSCHIERAPGVFEHEGALQKYIGRVFDLHPVVKDHYYHPQMRGSFSIKTVVPVIAPELRYDELDEVQEGTAAQVAYLYATLDPNTTPARKAGLEARLRVYCRQDTWAMVEVAYFLSRSGRPQRPDGM